MTLGQVPDGLPPAGCSSWPEPRPPHLPTPWALQTKALCTLAGRTLTQGILGEQSGFPQRWGQAILGRPPDPRVVQPWETVHSSGPGPGVAVSLAQRSLQEPALALSLAGEDQGHKPPCLRMAHSGAAHPLPSAASPGVQGSSPALLLPLHSSMLLQQNRVSRNFQAGLGQVVDRKERRRLNGY